MKKNIYKITTKEETTVIIEKNILENIDSILAGKNYSSFLIIADEKTNKLFAEKLKESLKKLRKPIEMHVLPNGEESKNTTNLFRILEHLVEKSFDRKSAIIALGGGVIGDIATTVSGLYLRGIDCIQIPTTLIAQVDASIGGKGAVNLRNYKNIVGIIRQPKYIVIDPKLLESLPEDQYTSGMGEITKYAIAMDKKLFTILEKKINLASLLPIITSCVELKMNVVKKDPDEKTGERQCLNFGHTLGHAIELYAHLSHGEAVAIGMVFAILISKKLNMLSQNDAQKAIKLLKSYSLPTTIPKKSISKDTIYEHMKKDKKAINGIPTFVLLETIGKVKIGCIVPKNIIDETLEEIII